MRTFMAVSRWLSAGIFALILLLATTSPAHADTGTYRILNYTATLEPQSNGAVRITYEQEWQVLSGNIPWITVGLPDSSFTVEKWGGVAASVYPDNSEGWSGVRADLNRTYLTGDTFQVSFTVMQNNLLEKLSSDKKWRIDYIPGWYDRAVIDRLTVILNSPVSLDSYILTEPSPGYAVNGVMRWETINLSPGARFRVKFESVDGSFLSATTPGAKKGTNPLVVVIGILIVVAIIGIIIVAVIKAKQARETALRERIAATEQELAADGKKKAAAEKGFREYIIKEDIKPDEQGRYYDRGYGDYITPAIWAAVIMNQQRINQTGTSGVRSSCACACVSCACACACACAGGGAAGCARKTLHECKECSDTSCNLLTWRKYLNDKGRSEDV